MVRARTSAFPAPAPLASSLLIRECLPRSTTVTSRVRTLRSIVAAGLCATVMTLWPVDASAQRRGRPGGGRVVVASPLYFGYGFYDPFFWGWGPGFGPGWGFPGWYPPFGGAWGGTGAGAARLQITPKQAEVYVDGYLAGSVDDFDGVFQRLDVAPGEHELTIYLEGYQTITQKVYFQPGETLEIRQRMAPLAPGETSGPRPTAAAASNEPPAETGTPAARPSGPWGLDADPGARRQPLRRHSARWQCGCSRRMRRCSWTAKNGRRPKATARS